MLSPEEQKLRTKLFWYLDGLRQRGELDQLAYSVQSAAGEFWQGLGAVALAKLSQRVRTLHGRCGAAGAYDGAVAVPFGKGGCMFAVPTGAPAWEAVAVEIGGERFVTLVKSSAEGAVERAVAAAWKPAQEFDMAWFAEVAEEDYEAALARADEKPEIVGAESDFDLGRIVRRVVEDGNAPSGSRFASMEVMDIDGLNVAMSQGRVRPDLFRYLMAMAPAMSVEPTGVPLVVARVLRAEDIAPLVEHDGGYPGRLTAACAAEMSKLQLLIAAQTHGDVIGHNAADFEKLGYVWGEKFLAYNDTDIHSFAIPTGDPRLTAVVHRNIDLCAAPNSFLVLVERGEDGRVVRLEGHNVYDPVWQMAEWGEDWEDTVAELARQRGSFINPQAVQPRFGASGFADLLASGSGLPEPVFSVDLRTEAVRFGPGYGESVLPQYLAAVARNDRSVLDVLLAGEWPEHGCEERTWFLENGPEAESAASHESKGLGYGR